MPPRRRRPTDDDLGLVWLRSMLAIRAGLSRADVPGADQLIVTAGIQAAIAAVARTWLGPGPDRRGRRGLPGRSARRPGRHRGTDRRPRPRRRGPAARSAARAGRPHRRRPGDRRLAAATPLGMPARRRLLEWAGSGRARSSSRTTASARSSPIDCRRSPRSTPDGTGHRRRRHPDRDRPRRGARLPRRAARAPRTGRGHGPRRRPGARTRRAGGPRAHARVRRLRSRCPTAARRPLRDDAPARRRWRAGRTSARLRNRP